LTNRKAILDRDHLARYTMNCQELEREIIGLFLQQLPATVALLKAAANHADWKLATHTLKGSAAAVGATLINEMAVELESYDFDVNVNVKSKLMLALDTAVAQFRLAVERIYR
jgi:HPt (histidine-containing phosphotransfer) domain-containing protein